MRVGATPFALRSARSSVKVLTASSSPPPDTARHGVSLASRFSANGSFLRAWQLIGKLAVREMKSRGRIKFPGSRAGLSYLDAKHFRHPYFARCSVGSVPLRLSLLRVLPVCFLSFSLFFFSSTFLTALRSVSRHNTKKKKTLE